MTRTLCIVFLLAGVGFVASLDARTAVTTRKTNCVREGPGAYYPLLAMLPENTRVEILEEGSQWVRVKLPERKAGWLASSCLAPKPAAGRKPVELTAVWSSPKASRAGISAAIKGFAGKYGKTDPGNIELLLKYRDKTFGQPELELFAGALRPARGSSPQKISLADLDIAAGVYDPSFTEQEVGGGIAARLVARGLVTNERLRTYVNMIAAVLVQRSSIYDWDFTVYVLDDPKLNAYAAPGGYIFISRGAIELCGDEAELAAIIAHEIGHVIARHGLTEMTERRAHIKSDEAFAELEEETGGPDPDTGELETYMEQAYERIVAPRLGTYEKEADKIAAALCLNAGYDPYGILRISETTLVTAERATDVFDPDYMAPDTARQRHDAIRAFLEEQAFSRTSGARLSERLRPYKTMR